MSAVRLTPRMILAALLYPLRTAVGRWRRSMLLRVVASTIIVGLGSVAMLGAYVTSQIRDGLVETSLERLLGESAQDAVTAQERMDSAPNLTPADQQVLINDLIIYLRNVGGDNRGVLVLKNPQNTSGVPITDAESSAGLAAALTSQIRAAVQEDHAQSWQHVGLGTDATPGVVVGAPLFIPEAGKYELYFVYSLVDEKSTLSLIQNVLTLGGFVLVGLVVFMTWTVTLQAVRPVRHAARVAARLAEGLLGERMVVRGRDEMATLATTFNEMAESLQRQITRMEDLSRLQRRFVSDVSHELRTPLTTVRMASDVLHEARADFSPEAARSAELLNAQLDRFEALLADLLEISRIDAGAAQLEFEDTDLLAAVRDETSGLAPVAEELGVPLRVWASDGPHIASMDRPRVSRIVRNLVSNAIEYADGKPVDILVGSNRRGVAVVVRDYGQGMTPQQVERVFDRFWRADAARTRSMGGTGLGLSIAREDAQLHGGRLEAWGSPRNGASFRLTLPRTSEGLGQRPVVPLVLRKEQFPKEGEPVNVMHIESAGHE